MYIVRLARVLVNPNDEKRICSTITLKINSKAQRLAVSLAKRRHPHWFVKDCYPYLPKEDDK